MRRLALVAIAVALSGCAAKYGCKGMPNDPVCLSTTDAYQASNHAVSPPSSADARKKGKDVRAAPADAAPARWARAPYPKIDDPTPIRTPSRVMRVWIAPWEDAEGDLMVSGYLYTELEPRRWMIGPAAPAVAPSLAPLQVERRQPESSPRVRAAGAGAFAPSADTDETDTGDD
ncbi:conjugal transfer protein TraV [Methylocaldum sp. BRCS4]|nr:conjugal transfer protein TraV [Methylocaldum sp. BRCS4]